MSATVDVQLFMSFFSGAQHISVPGRMFPVKEFFLEDILLGIDYSNKEMDKLRKSGISKESKSEALAKLTSGLQGGEQFEVNHLPASGKSKHFYGKV